MSHENKCIKSAIGNDQQRYGFFFAVVKRKIFLKKFKTMMLVA